jgi:excisionase family DNA binding protein
MTISNLNSHPATYVTVAELAKYWEVTREQVYKHIRSGRLPALRLGPRCFRVRTSTAAAFERMVSSKKNEHRNVDWFGGPKAVPTLFTPRNKRV